MNKALVVALAVLAGAAAGWGQSGANSDATYIALRNLSLGTEAVSVSSFDLKRDAGIFRFKSGTVCFASPVNGKVTGAVFTGDGEFLLTPPTEQERKSLNYLTKETEFHERFERLILRFTDSTYEELKKAGTPTNAGCDAGLWKDSQNMTRHKLRHNLEEELLGEVLSPEPREMFVAFIHGKRYADREMYKLDPNVNREQVDFSTYDDNRWGDWASFSFTAPHTPDTTGQPISIEHHVLDTTLERNATLSGKATTTFVSRRNGLRVVRLQLFSTLRVQEVTADGKALAFIQEDKNDDPDFAVILPKALTAGEKFSITTSYSGKEAVINTGGGNYYPVARNDWYPNNLIEGEYASYDMTFRIPKGMKIAATGVQTSASTESGQEVSAWKSESPQTVAGFSIGRFKVEEAKLSKPPMAIESYANEQSPDWVSGIQHAVDSDRAAQHAPDSGLPGQRTPGSAGPRTAEVALGSMSTVVLNKKALAEGELAVQLYTDYFGPSSFTHLQLTQQTACNYGQSWPSLVWIPICYYFDATVRHQLGIQFGSRGYWKVVTPHEVAHQWWGHTVGYDSERDQWMSEGFSDFSASLYLSFIEKDSKKFNDFWNDEKELLLERDPQGFRAIDAAPLTMGYRANNSRTGGITRRLIYPKGAYVLHMVRTMMFDSRNSDKAFKETMQDFVNTYRGKSATTEEFKAMIEKHMTPGMDADGNHKMDWFFNQYVYGTGIAQYTFSVTVETMPDGKSHVKGQITRTGVPGSWRDVIPLYAHVGDKTARLGTITVRHDAEPIDITLPMKIDRVSINDNADLLAEVKQ
jgi:hypothetical protein